MLGLAKVIGQIIVEALRWLREYAIRRASPTEKLKKIRKLHEEDQKAFELAVMRRSADKLMARFERLRKTTRNRGPTRPDKPGS